MKLNQCDEKQRELDDIMNDAIDLVNKEKRKHERIKAVRRFAAGAGIIAAACGIIRIIISAKPTSGNQNESADKVHHCKKMR